ncbi:PAS domain S-box protein [Aromatoleum toluclasticum]|uniref:PAS domain S-box protein n=1 Tax=Aromatoleum toluclasticum TaxID=92003 RepID=UPI001D198048|nr:PAS domain S-box protein [Aromatoleum toluclasticum]MCC4115831.1 PAS domain S-box protein [Aromatoleum toluclasticum]
MKLPNFRWRTLNTRVTFVTLCIFLASIWLLAWYASHVLRGDMQRLLGEQQFSTATIMAAGVNDDLAERLHALEVVAGTFVEAAARDPSELQMRLERYPVLVDLFNGGVMVLDVHGTAIADMPRSVGRIGLNYMERDHVAAALGEGRAMVGRPVIGKKLSAPVLGMSVPIRDAQGRVLGAVFGVTDLSKANFIDKIARNVYGRTGGYVLVAPQYRVVLAASDKRRIMEVLPAPGVIPAIDRFLDGYEGSAVFRNVAGVEILGSAKGVPLPGWYVAVVLPIEEAFAPIREVQRRVLAAAFLLSLLVAGLTWVLLKRQLAPILNTVKTLAAFSDSEQFPHPLPIVRADEVGELIGGFNRLLDALSQRKRALKENEQKLATILQSVDAHIYMKDRNGRYLFANRKACEPFGLTESEIVGYGDEKLFDAETVARIRMVDAQVLENGDSVRTEQTVQISKDGGTSTYLTFKLPLRDERGEIYALCGISTDITERKQVEETLRESRVFVQGVLDSVPNQIAVLDGDGMIVAVNEPWRRFAIENGVEPGKPAPNTDVGTSYLAICGASDNGASGGASDGIRAVLDGRLPSFSLEYPCHSPHAQRWFTMTVNPLGASRKGVVVMHSDITSRKLAEDGLRLAASVFTHAYEGIALTTVTGEIIDVNDAFCRITGYSREEVLGGNPRILKSGRHDEAFYASLWQRLAEEGSWQGEMWNRRKSGEIYPEQKTITAVRDEHGQVRHYVALGSDITERKNMEEQIRQLAFYDPLTNLPNRRLFHDRLRQALAARKRTGCQSALLFLDLDNFKPLNDTHGHDVGDLLLVEVARRLQSCVREIDTVARFGGDEFVVMLGDLQPDRVESRRHAEFVAQKVLERLSDPYELTAGHAGERARTVRHRCSASIGVAMFLDTDASEDLILKRADAAMYQAKEAGRGAIRFIDPEEEPMLVEPDALG